MPIEGLAQLVINSVWLLSPLDLGCATIGE